MAEKLYFGVPGNIQEIPYPVSGMGFDSNVDTEVTELVSGGRSVYRAPTAYKTLNPNWRSNSANLAHLIDMYNGQFGPGPFYITDPTANQMNVLPARWSNAWQLAHQANGWCRPVIQTGWYAPDTPDFKQPLTDRRVKFTQAASGSTVKLEGVVRTRLIRIPGKAYYLAAYGAATGGAGIRVRGFNSVAKVWDTFALYADFTGTPNEVVTSVDSTYTMIELDLYLPLGSTLTLKGMSLGTVYYVPSTARTNLFTHPSAETSAIAWTSVIGSNTVTASTAQAWQGASSYAFLTSATGSHETVTPTGTSAFPVTAGLPYSLSFYSKAATAAKTVTPKINWYNAAGALISTSADAAPITNGTGGWTRHGFTATAPALAVYASVQVRFSVGLSASETHYMDGFLLEQSSAINAYFDGATPAAGSYTYSWVGTANASASTETLTNPTTSLWMPRGSGIGAVQFSNNAGGELVSSVIDRVGLSLQLTEVQNVESVML